MNIPLCDVIAEYLVYLRVEQGGAKTTAKTYGAHLRHFLHWMQANGYPAPVLSDLAPPLIRRFVLSLGDRNLRPRSIRSYIHALRGLAVFAVKTDLRSDNFAAGVSMPKKDAPVRETPDDEQVRMLLDAIERDTNTRRMALRRALLHVLIWGAVRRAELLDLMTTDVNLSEKCITIRNGKGGKARFVYLPDVALNALREWFALRGECRHPYLFAYDPKRRLHFKGLAALITDLCARAGLHHCTALKPHSLRHWRATDLLRAGADLKTVSTVLGHSSLQTTAVYLHSTEREARNAASLTCMSVKPPTPELSPLPEPAAQEPPRLRIVGRSERDDRRPLRRLAR